MNIISDKVPASLGHYPHAKKAGNLLFLSGIGSRRKDNSIPNTFEEEVHQVFENIKNVLDDSNSSLSNIVDITVFLTNMKDNFQVFNKIYAQYFSNHLFPPTRTTLEVKNLPSPINIELKIIAEIK